MRGLLLVLLAATGASVHGVSDSTGAMRADASPAAATLIDFETYPNGTPTCNLCPITNDYASQGLEISWTSQKFPGTSATLANGVGSLYGDAARTRNHFVMWSVNAQGQGQNGVLTMTFPSLPDTVRFDRSTGTGGLAAPVLLAFDGAGNQIPPSQITVTFLQKYQSVGGFTFIWEQVTVWGAAGIQRVVLDMEQGVGQLVDNVYFAGTHAPPPGFRLSSVSTGNYFTCGLDPKGAAWCWGSDNGGFLGNDTLIAASLKPVVVAGDGRYTQLDAGADFTCALRNTQPWCWGGNAWGQIGAPAVATCVVNGVTLPCNPTPAAVPVKGYVTITAGSLHACALDTAGQAFCWGWNPNGELGHTSAATCTLATQTVPCSPVPTAVAPGPAGPLTFVAISAGAQHTCALDKGGQVYCWGANYAGEFGNGSSSGPHMSPVPGPAKLLFSAISAGNGFTCGLENGTNVPYCWGQNASGQLGDGTTNASLTPVPVAGGKAFKTLRSIRAGLWYTCGLTAAGRGYCWGRNNNGQLGDGTAIEKHLPVAVGGGLTFASLATLGSGDANHTCAIATTTSETYCWGLNSNGQLGNGTTAGSMTPVKVVP